MLEQEQLDSASISTNVEVSASAAQPEVSKLSKNQQKKLRKLEKRQQFQMVKRQQERQRKKEKRKLEAAKGIVHPSRKKLRCDNKSAVDITVVIDASFEEHMVDNDIRKLTNQIQHCYAMNRRSSEPFKYFVTSYGGKAKHIIETQQSGSRWDVSWCANSYDDIFPYSRIIYLAAESENVLESVDVGKVYVIGGLVDHNSKKGLCYKLAVEKGIAHARLPISEYIQLDCRKVLTVDHVFGILQKFYETKDWETAFFSVIPKRKGAQSKKSPSTADQIHTATQSELKDSAVSGTSKSSVSHGDDLVTVDLPGVVTTSIDAATKSTAPIREANPLDTLDVCESRVMKGTGSGVVTTSIDAATKSTAPTGEVNSVDTLNACQSRVMEGTGSLVVTTSIDAATESTAPAGEANSVDTLDVCESRVMKSTDSGGGAMVGAGCADAAGEDAGCGDAQSNPTPSVNQPVTYESG